MILNIVAFDPALSNLGIAYFTYNSEDEKLTLKHLDLVQTEPTKDKKVRKGEDDFERAQVLRNGMMLACRHADIAIAEIPGGTQDARGAMSNGISIGVMAGCPIPLIKVSPIDVKKAAVGVSSATKKEMIEWAMNKYPHKCWLMRKLKGEMVPLNDNEHLADACGVAEAGIRSSKFKQAVQLMELPSLIN